MASLIAVSLASVAEAREPPHIRVFCFDRGAQDIGFEAQDFFKGQGFDFEITSSSNQTTFSAPQSGRVNAPGGGTSWGITPGGAAVGEIHTFTISCTNANGTSRRTMRLRVVRGQGPEGIANLYEDEAGVPTVSEWGLIVLTLSLLTAGTVFLARRRTVLAGAGVGSVELSNRPGITLFVPLVFVKALAATMALVVVGFAGVIWLFGSISTTDAVGTLISAPLLAYLVHLWIVLARASRPDHGNR